MISLSQEANPTTVSATVLCNAPITLCLFTLSEDLQGKYHHFKLSYVVISWGRALHILFTAVPSVHNTTWDTWICLTYLTRRTVNFYIKFHLNKGYYLKKKCLDYETCRCKSRSPDAVSVRFKLKKKKCIHTLFTQLKIKVYTQKTRSKCFDI